MERIHANDFVQALDPKVVISIMWLVKLLRCFKWSWVKILWLEMIQILPKTDGPGALRLKSRQHEEVLGVRLGLGGAQNVCLYLFVYWDHGNIHKPLKRKMCMYMYWHSIWISLVEREIFHWIRDFKSIHRGECGRETWGFMLGLPESPSKMICHSNGDTW